MKGNEYYNQLITQSKDQSTRKRKGCRDRKDRKVWSELGGGRGGGGFDGRQSFLQSRVGVAVAVQMV